MKKTIILSLVSLALSMSAHAQDQPEYHKAASTRQASATATEEYMLVSLSATNWGKSYKAELEFADKTMSIEEYIKTDTKKKHEYPTTVAVMNALNQLGWEFVNYIPDAEGKLDRDHFLMRRKLIGA